MTEDLRILVVDDEPFMHKLLSHMLRGLGFDHVMACENGRIALQIVRGERPPDLILLDLNMPGMDGIEIVRRLGEEHYRGSLILVSGEDERVLQTTVQLVLAHHIAVLGHLRKPVSPSQLETLIDQWAPGQSPAAAEWAYEPAELRAAIDRHELTNYYQPKVCVKTGAVVGVETLVRWKHPTHGMVYPDRFIGLAEENGLIDDLTGVVLADAFAQARVWKEQGLHLRVAVNLSMDSFSSVSFAQVISSAAQTAGVSPGDVVLEITESRLMLDHRAPLEVLTRLRLQRFRLSIDDFGTGHSSLSQLRDIPFDELKIDRSFVHGAWQDRTALAMYNASLGLGKELGMEVVAEGVEDSDDWELLRRTGCDLAQGYFVARPMPAADFPAWMARWARDRVGLTASAAEPYPVVSDPTRACPD